MSFETWFASLISDTLWYELLRAYKPDTIKKAGEKVFAQLVADSTVDVRPMSENRKHVYNILCKNPGDKVSKPWYVQEAEKKEIEEKMDDQMWEPVTGEEREKRLKEWAELVKNATITNAVPRLSYKELAEEGGVLPPKPAPYPCTSKEEAYVRDRHFEYIKANYEPRSGMPLPSWVPESEWSKKYDEKHLTDKGL